VVDTTAVDFTASDRADLQAIKVQTDKLQFTAENHVKATLGGEEVTVGSLSEGAQSEVNQACDQALSDYGPAKPEDVEITVP